MKRLKIVPTETDPQMRDFFLIALEHLGHHIERGVDSVSGLVDACIRQSPDLVVCALTLKDGDGIEAIRKVSKIKPTPIVLAVAHLDSALLGADIRNCAVACFVQPIDVTNLKDTIAAAMVKFKEAGSAEEGKVSLTDSIDTN